MPKSMISLSADLDFDLSESVRSVYSFVIIDVRLSAVSEMYDNGGEGAGRVEWRGADHRRSPVPQISYCVLQETNGVQVA